MKGHDGRDHAYAGLLVVAPHHAPMLRGWQALCACGWRSVGHSEIRLARSDVNNHIAYYTDDLVRRAYDSAYSPRAGAGWQNPYRRV